MNEWLIDAADLLDRPDPGPTRWLVEGLIVDKALVAAVGKWKTTKSYAFLEVCIAIATGRPAFGTLAIPEPGPVVFINEESGLDALWRRLDSLTRGRAIAREELRGQLHVAANTSIKLDDPAWQAELVKLGQRLRPRLFVFDPLARMKHSSRDENVQTDMAPLIEFLRQLRRDTDAAVAFVHHTGHEGTRMRGSSDLESAWETRLTWKRDGQSALIDVEAEHREAEASEHLQYRIAWDTATRTIRLDATPKNTGPTLADRIVEYLSTNPSLKTEEIAKGIGVRKEAVLRELEVLERAGNGHRGPSGRQDRAGRPIRDKVWNLSTDQGSWPFPDDGTTGNDQGPGTCGSVPVPVPIGTGGTEQPPGTPWEDEPDPWHHDDEPALEAGSRG